MTKCKNNKLLEFEEEELLRYLKMKLSNMKNLVIISESVIDLYELKMQIYNLLDDLGEIRLNAKFKNIRDKLDELFREFTTVKTMIKCKTGEYIKI